MVSVPTTADFEVGELWLGTRIWRSNSAPFTAQSNLSLVKWTPGLANLFLKP